MKTVVKGAIRDEKGNVLILVLILLVVGGLILTPLLGLMSTGLLAGQVYERKMQEYYAADAGIEDALWKIQHNEIQSGAYNLTVNDKYVWVSVNGIDTGLFLANLLGVDPKNWGHSNWTVIGKTPEPGIAEIAITWNGSGNLFLTDVGIWMSGNYSYVEGQTIPDDDIRHEDHYPDYTFEQKAYSGGTGFIWTWPNANQANGPSFDEENHTMTLTFEFSPESIPEQSIAFTMAGRQDVGLTYDSSFALYTITATAISDSDTATADIDSQTIVVANVVRSGCDVFEIEVLNWNIS